VAERNRLESSVSNWAAAVTARDERLSEAARQVGALVAERDEAVKRFNDLAERHNRLAKEWNELQSRLAEKGHSLSPGPSKRD
jgi:uncharacterized coiled-coil DUF342 family protein